MGWRLVLWRLLKTKKGYSRKLERETWKHALHCLVLAGFEQEVIYKVAACIFFYFYLDCSIAVSAYPDSEEGGEVHGVFEDHPVHHLDVVIPHQARGGGGGEAGVGLSSSHAGVHYSGLGVRKGLKVKVCVNRVYLWKL